ncbi:MAG: NAD(P)-dependent oxidoreductase [Candidatus Deferrimicrobiaceae bacterium]
MKTRDAESVLVTGASGFIGQHLVRRLIGRGDRVSCLVRPTSRIDELRSTGARLIVGDATDRAGMERALAESQADVVFHPAGLLKAVRTADFARVNAGGVESVAAACADRAERPALIVVSSLAASGPCAGNQPRVEGDSPTPVSVYGRSKLAGEQAAAMHAGEMEITIVRPPIVFGPGDRGVLEMFRPIARSGLHVVPGRGERRVSLIHVADLVALLLLAAEKGERLHPDGAPGQGVYFAAAEHDPTYAELGQAMARALGKKRATVVHMPGPLVRLVGLCGDSLGRVRQRAGWVNSDKMAEALAGSWMCSSAKARVQLGWSPAATLAERLRETAQWYRQAGWL